MHNAFLRWAAILGALAVALGAFGAHGLRGKVPEQALNTFETAVRYHFYHVLALTFISILFKEFSNRWMVRAGYLFITGIALFSRSLYLLTFILSAGNLSYKWIGAITPFGGLALIAGWICMFMGVVKARN